MRGAASNDRPYRDHRSSQIRFGGPDQQTTSRAGAGCGDGPAHPGAVDEPLPKGYARWTGPLLAAALGDVHEQQVWRFLRTQKIDLTGRKSWCESSDPAFGAGAGAGLSQAAKWPGADRS